MRIRIERFWRYSDNMPVRFQLKHPDNYKITHHSTNPEGYRAYDVNDDEGWHPYLQWHAVRWMYPVNNCGNKYLIGLNFDVIFLCGIYKVEYSKNIQMEYSTVLFSYFSNSITFHSFIISVNFIHILVGKYTWLRRKLDA